MKFQTIGNAIINLDNVLTISIHDQDLHITKKYDDDAGDVVTKLEGEPYEIHFGLVNGEIMKLRYKSVMARDRKFQDLERNLTALK